MVYLQFRFSVNRMVSMSAFRMPYESMVGRAERKYDIAVQPVAKFPRDNMVIFYLVPVCRLVLAAGPMTCIFNFHIHYI